MLKNILGLQHSVKTLAIFTVCLGIFTFSQKLIASEIYQLSPGSAYRDDRLDGEHIFSLHGSNTIGARLAPALVKSWMEALGAQNVRVSNLEKENEYRVRGDNNGQPMFVEIKAHGSGTGYQGLVNGEAQIAMSSRRIKNDEMLMLERFGDIRSFDTEKIIAIDGLAVIVNRSNPIQSLTVDEIARLFSGEITNWSTLGGMDMPISIYARDDKSGTWDTFKSLVLAKQYALDKSAQRFESNDKLSDTVSSDLGGIGFVGLASVRQAKALEISDGQTLALEPSPLHVATEDYPLARRLYMYIKPTEDNIAVSNFIDYVQSSSGQEIVTDIGFISQNPVRMVTQAPEAASDAYRILSENAERLSVNFRFEENKAELDNKAKQDILRLANYSTQRGKNGKYIQLVGFGDSHQEPRRALVLSRLRAIAVKAELFEYGIVSAPVWGEGQLIPVAANDEIGRLKNRRVEVWVYDEAAHEKITQARDQARKLLQEQLTYQW